MKNNIIYKYIYIERERIHNIIRVLIQIYEANDYIFSSQIKSKLPYSFNLYNNKGVLNSV